DAVPSLKGSSLKILIGNLAPLNVEWYSWPPIKEPCRSGGTGRRKGLKIPRFERTVPVQVRSPAPRPLLLLHIVSIEPESINHLARPICRYMCQWPSFLER